MGIRITDEVSMISTDPFAVLRKLDISADQRQQETF